MCQHGRRRITCRECGTARLCEHDKRRYQCSQCHNFVCEMPTCHLSGHKFAKANSLQMHMQSFHAENPKALTKSKELDIYQSLETAGIDFEYQKHLPFRSCGLASETAGAFIDFSIQKHWGVILLECDEQQHSAYDPSCDVRRDFDSCASITLGSQHKAVILRYNPDAFQIGGRTRRTTKKERQTKLIETLQAWDEDPALELGFARFFLFYDAADDAAPLPLVAQNWSEEVRALSRRLA